MIIYIIMSSCHIIIEENKILRPQTYNIRVLWQCNVGKTCEGVCEDPSTQASKHCTAIPSFVCKIVIAKFFYDVASLNFAKEYTILSQRLHLVHLQYMRFLKKNSKPKYLYPKPLAPIGCQCVPGTPLVHQLPQEIALEWIAACTSS